jgi:hypothetical protein
MTLSLLSMLWSVETFTRSESMASDLSLTPPVEEAEDSLFCLAQRIVHEHCEYAQFFVVCRCRSSGGAAEEATELFRSILLLQAQAAVAVRTAQIAIRSLSLLPSSINIQISGRHVEHLFVTERGRQCPVQ